ncbi:DUF6088 family protein [Pedobacter rhizosphaerae]|uniref:Transcriptional regulator, AbiEi antitoxin, Type IV TA system n=1 Tax=Pedobacter rhizosphaerae TaxID=390241 RepID=A0A1H9VNX1_9SPHI|nr:DUF6088 family protein [Pedobacter rhizosphaerae]SES23426.1 hypothetical protein SAMN04488023_14616 [Pedobacter rhizosphaerae]
MSSIHLDIVRSIKRRKPGTFIFPADFRGVGSGAAVKMALGRLSRNGQIMRIAHGIYIVPKKDPVFGVLMPAMEDIAQAIAKKDKVRIKPAGVYALHRLGLSTQVPTKLVYITDGPPRQIKVGKSVIKFKTTTPKKLSMKGVYSSLIIQALEEIGVDNTGPVTRQKFKELLARENGKALMEDLKICPVKISDYLLKLIRS